MKKEIYDSLCKHLIDYKDKNDKLNNSSLKGKEFVDRINRLDSKYISVFYHLLVNIKDEVDTESKDKWNHTGICMCQFDDSCFDECVVWFECLKLYKKEKEGEVL